MDLLPEDLLADILRRLPPRPLAMCRSVSKSLRTVVDGWGLLAALAHRVPGGLFGIFINTIEQDRPDLFSRRASAAAGVDRKLRFLEAARWWRLQVEVEHHCNGLVLFQLQRSSTLCVCNPATERWAKLPERPEGAVSKAHLVFDPTVSLHYEVISFPDEPPMPRIGVHPGVVEERRRPTHCQGCSFYMLEEIKNLPYSLKADYEDEIEKGSVEWPPSSYMAQVFSSRTGRWEERAYVREGDVSVTLMDVWSDPWGPNSVTLTYLPPRCNAVCWRGAFHIHCRGGFVKRLSLLEHKYQVIKTPELDNLFTKPRLNIYDYLGKETGYKNEKEYLRRFLMDQERLDTKKPFVHLGKSEHGIYYTALMWHQLQVWVLHEASESQPMPEWELNHKVDIEPSMMRHYMREKDRDGEIEASWSLDPGDEGSDDLVGCGWDSSDDDDVTSVEGEDGVDSGNKHYTFDRPLDLLGYHPSKEIAFLGNRFDGFAYNLGSSKLHYLGTFYPVEHSLRQVAATHESFIYTPCMDDLLPDQERNTRHELDDHDEGEEEEEEEEVDIDEDEDIEEVGDEDFKSLEDMDNNKY